MAQSLRNPPVPAEIPPASYRATQFVDSKGCVFIRAGVAGNVTWVPRITRSREPLCGFAPSLAKAAPVPAPAPTQAARPSRRTAAAPVKPTPKPAAPVRKTVRAPAPAPAAGKPLRVVVINAPTNAPTARPATAPRATSAPGIKPAVRPGRVIVAPDPARTACTGWTGTSAGYSVQRDGAPVRCGPQTAHYVTYGRGGARGAAITPPPGSPATPDTVAPDTRVAPARVYARQKTSLAGIHVPAGMKPVWEDDRLNPRRAHQTFEGKARMDLAWTKTVPRRLIDRRTGADVIHNFPGLQPPYTSFEAQRAAGVAVVTRGRYVPDPTPVRAARAGARVTVSTRSTDARATPGPAPQKPRQKAHYAQAGIFADAAQAQAAAQRVTRAGLPGRRGTVERDGRRLTLVLAGPFASEAEARRGAARLRGMGFANVRLR